VDAESQQFLGLPRAMGAHEIFGARLFGAEGVLWRVTPGLGRRPSLAIEWAGRACRLASA